MNNGVESVQKLQYFRFEHVRVGSFGGISLVYMMEVFDLLW